MAEVKVIHKGIHRKDEDKLIISSTVTLIKADKNIVVDSGYVLDKESILDGLKNAGITPEEVDFVILTHTHLDHLYNLHLFPSADIIDKFKAIHTGRRHVVKEGYIEQFDVSDGSKICESVELLLTPGHTDDSISVVVNTADGKVVITGDAIANKDLVDLKVEPIQKSVVDMEQYNNSRKKILEVADYIVPGHGNIFKPEKDNEDN